MESESMDVDQSSSSPHEDGDGISRDKVRQHLLEMLAPEKHVHNTKFEQILNVHFSDGPDVFLNSLMEKFLEGHDSFVSSLTGSYMVKKDASKLFDDCYKMMRTVTGRVAQVTLGLDLAFVGAHDLRCLTEKIASTFSWYEDNNHLKYQCPSFPIVQSSGMGKTRLMKACRDMIKRKGGDENDGVLLLCLSDTERAPEGWKSYYDRLLRVPKGSDNVARNHLIDQLKFKYKGARVVIFFDEAQKLVELHNGFAYKCIQWWLRRERIDTRLVGVFAGTNSSLAKLYAGDRPDSGSSRDPPVRHLNDEKARNLYDPFLDLTTISCLKNHPEISRFETDFEKCSFYGRPLFPVMLEREALTVSEEDLRIESGKNVVANNVLYAILKRMMIDEIEHGWVTKSYSVMSMLGTRVQLGISTSADFIDQATSKGYANLVYHEVTPDTPEKVSWFSSQLTFMPDPVCAALAMGMMRPNWKLSESQCGNEWYCGRHPTFWSNEAAKSFSKRLFLPEKGDGGEVMAALHMLFVGDELREKKDPSMRSFEVSFLGWIERMMSPSDDVDANMTDGDDPLLQPPRKAKRVAEKKKETTSELKDPQFDVQKSTCINFIQVCRNYFRSHCWLTTNGLAYMYQAAFASYVYANCPAIDIVAPIRIRSEGADSFHPLLVSVKCWDTMCSSDMKKSLKAMKGYLDDYRRWDEPTAFCLLVVVGSEKTSKPPAPSGSFPDDDAFATVIVSDNDRFDVSKSMKNIARPSVHAEMRASHYMAYVEEFEFAFRAKKAKDDNVFGRSLFEDKSQHSP